MPSNTQTTDCQQLHTSPCRGGDHRACAVSSCVHRTPRRHTQSWLSPAFTPCVNTTTHTVLDPWHAETPNAVQHRAGIWSALWNVTDWLLAMMYYRLPTAVTVRCRPISNTDRSGDTAVCRRRQLQSANRSAQSRAAASTERIKTAITRHSRKSLLSKQGAGPQISSDSTAAGTQSCQIKATSTNDNQAGKQASTRTGVQPNKGRRTLCSTQHGVRKGSRVANKQQQGLLMRHSGQARQSHQPMCVSGSNGSSHRSNGWSLRRARRPPTAGLGSLPIG